MRILVVENKMLTKVEKGDIIIYLNESAVFRVNDIRRELKIEMEHTKPLDIDILADYLISKFKRTLINNEKIRCNRTKLGKLLTIVQLFAVRKTGSAAFSAAIYNDVCGTVIPDLNALNYPYYIVGEMSDKNRNANYTERNQRIFSDDIHFIFDNEDEIIEYELPKEIKEIIDDVFMEFGWFQSNELGKYIDQFKEELFANNDFVDEKTIKSFFEGSSHNELDENPILSFVYRN